MLPEACPGSPVFWNELGQPNVFFFAKFNGAIFQNCSQGGRSRQVSSLRSWYAAVAVQRPVYGSCPASKTTGGRS